VSGDILFYKETDLPPGVHTLELVAYREHTHTASVRIATVETGKPAPGIPQVSSLMILQSAERAGTRPENTAAVHFGDWLLVPNLGEPVDGDTELAFAFAIEGSVATSHPKAAARILSGRTVDSWRAARVAAAGCGWPNRLRRSNPAALTAARNLPTRGRDLRSQQDRTASGSIPHCEPIKACC